MILWTTPLREPLLAASKAAVRQMRHELTQDREPSNSASNGNNKCIARHQYGCRSENSKHSIRFSATVSTVMVTTIPSFVVTILELEEQHGDTFVEWRLYFVNASRIISDLCFVFVDSLWLLGVPFVHLQNLFVCYCPFGSQMHSNPVLEPHAKVFENVNLMFVVES